MTKKKLHKKIKKLEKKATKFIECKKMHCGTCEFQDKWDCNCVVDHLHMARDILEGKR